MHFGLEGGRPLGRESPGGDVAAGVRQEAARRRGLQGAAADGGPPAADAQTLCRGFRAAKRRTESRTSVSSAALPLTSGHRVK